jgi:hypothetical protein
VDVRAQLIAPLSRTPDIRELELSNCNEMLLKELPIGMHKLRNIKGINALKSITEEMIDSNGGLQEFVIGECSSLASLPKDGLLSTLKTLDINFCSSLWGNDRLQQWSSRVGDERLLESNTYGLMRNWLNKLQV